MKRKTLVLLLALCGAFLAAELGFIGFLNSRPAQNVLQTTPTQATWWETTGGTLAAPDTTGTQAATELTTAPTDDTTAPQETEGEKNRFVLTFTGDCTLGSHYGDFSSPHSFVGTVGTDYGFPFRNVRDIFENDDFTMINLECVLADTATPDYSKTFNFRGPTAYSQILTGSSVEAVTLANNHTLDFGQGGYDSTKRTLDSAGVAYVEADKTTLYTLEGGLVIGLYADSLTFSKADIEKNIKSLKAQGADLIICAFHWGGEGKYRPTADQQNYGKLAIDAGADIVYGTHPHVLQKIEEYNGGVIYYSLGNFSFGGNNYPRDLDSAIVQQEVIREEDGSVRLGQLTIIPVSISSLPVQNNFQPTPCAVGSEQYQRVLSKLDGTFTGADLVVDYSHLHPDPTEGTTPPATDAPEGTNPPSTEAPEGTTPPATDAPESTTPPATNPPATEAPAPPSTDPPAPPATQAPAPPAGDGGDGGNGGTA